MTIGELIQRVQSLYSRGVQSDDSRLSPRHIYNKLVSVRSRLIWEKLEYKKKISDWNYQIINCVEMIKVPNHECSCLVPTGCEVIRSKHKLPKPFIINGEPALKYVSHIDRNYYYSRTTPNRQQFANGNKYTSSKPSWFIENEYLYITQRYGPLVLSVSGLFEDPLEVDNFPQYCPKNTDTDSSVCESNFDKEFPIDGDLIEPMIQQAVTELVDLFSRMPEDLTNDTKDSPSDGAK